MSAEKSVGFDRAAEYYDRTRVISAETIERMTALLVGELEGRGRCLEVGVGTGQVSLPLHHAGIPMVGLDISLPMLEKLVEKAGGLAVFPVAVGDATALPFRDRAFGGAVLRHVLHLIPDHGTAIEELARVLRPGSPVLASQGAWSGVAGELQSLVAEQAGADAHHLGIDPHDADLMDRSFRERGFRPRAVDPILGRSDVTVGEFVESIEQGCWSWTWRVTEDDRRAGGARVLAWARARGLSPDDPLEPEYEIRWRAYDLEA